MERNSESSFNRCLAEAPGFLYQLFGFEQVDEDFYKVYFREVEIGEFDAEALRFRPLQVLR